MAVASNNAILNIGRLNAFRLNYVDPALKKVRDTTLSITLDGVPLKVRLGSLSIHDVINDAPNTATLVVDDATPPTVGKRLRVTLGIDPAYLLFAGTLQAARQSYVGRAHADAWACEAIDDTARADWLRPFGAWDGVSATTVAQQIVSGFMPGFSSAGVQAGLPPVTVYLDGTERVNGALRLLAKLVGGYYYFEDYVLHLFTGDEPGANPDDVTGAPGQLLEDPRLEAASDDSQIRTRCYGKGHAEPTIAAVNAGDTLIPIANAVMFNPNGGKAISEWQRLTYTGTAIGGDGALVGPGVTPSAAPITAVASGAGVDAGAHSYAYSWLTAAGQTLISPVAAVTVGDTPTPTTAPTLAADLSTWSTQGGHVVGDTLRVAICFSGDINATIGVSPLLLGPSIVVPAWSGGGNNPAVINWTVAAYVRPSALASYRQIYVSKNGGAYQREISAAANINGFPPGSTVPASTGIFATYSSGAAYPGANPASRRVNVTGIAIGPASVTARYLYRSKANTTTPLYLVAAWNDNVTTTFLDTIADAALVTATMPPATDTSGLQMPAGQVLPGAASMPVAGTGWARAAGGWAVVGNGQQVIRYTGISGNTITGIPASGAGAITAAVNYNSTITGAPMLLGVGGLGAALILGAPINIWVQVDDTAAQSALAARVGGSGIVEQLIIDERRGEPSLIALCTADLVRYGRPIVTIRYTTFDPKSRSGRPVRVHLTQPAIDQTLTIQDVTITTTTAAQVRPRFTVTASSIRTSLEDLLRRMVGTLEEGF